MKGLVTAVLVVLGACSGQEGESVNHPPFIAATLPGEGEIVTVGAGGAEEVTVTVGDQNVTDDLFIRFLVDYPSSTDPAHLVHHLQVPPSGTVVRAPIRLQLSCGNVGLGAGVHRLVFSVADRRFLEVTESESVDPDAPLDSVAEQGHRVRVIWLMNCP